MVTAFTVERFSIISTRPFDDIITAIDAVIGHPDMAEFQEAVASTETSEAMEAIVQTAVGSSGLMQFMRLNIGAAIGKGIPAYSRRSLRLIIGNPVIMRSMAKHVPDAGSYAPATILIDERADGVHLSYDRMGSFLAPYKQAAATKVAEDLDHKVESILTTAAG
jgi:hypothetical protein